MELLSTAPVAAVPKAAAVKITIPAPAPGCTPAPIATALVTPAPAPASAPGPAASPTSLINIRSLLDAHTPATILVNIRSLLHAHGEAVLRCALDHTPATATKLENDIAKAYQAIIEFLLSTVHEVEQTSSKFDSEMARRLLLASTTIGDLRQEVIDKSKEIARRDGEAKIQQALVDDLRYRNSVALKDKLVAETKLAKIEKETEAKRKRVEESMSKASKKANV